MPITIRFVSGPPVTKPDNYVIRTRAKLDVHRLEEDTGNPPKVIDLIEFGPTSSSNYIEIRPDSPEVVVDTLRTRSPIIETTIVEVVGGVTLSGRRLACPRQAAEYTQLFDVATPPNALTGDDDGGRSPRPVSDLGGLLIKLKVTVKHPTVDRESRS